MSLPSVEAIIVNYNTRDLMLDCVGALLASDYDGSLAVTVIDSASTDGSLEALKMRYPDVRGIAAENRGYGAAANVGALKSTADYVFILNADTKVEPGAVRALVDQIELRPEIGLAGPQLVHPHGEVQPSMRRFPSLLTPMWESTILEEWWPKNPWAMRYRMDDAVAREPQIVDWVVGAALMIRTGAFRAAGGFDETFRMYAEETDLCYRLRKHDWGTIIVPEAIVMHVEGASTSQDIPRRQAEFDASRVELQRRIHGAAAAWVAALGIRCGYALTIAREGLKWLLGHRRPLRASRIKFYLRLIRTDFKQHVGEQ